MSVCVLRGEGGVWGDKDVMTVVALYKFGSSSQRQLVCFIHLA